MRIATRSELRKHLKDLFKFIEIKEYTNAYDTTRRLHYSLRVYYMTRGRDASHFAKLFSNLEYLIVYATDCDMKTGILLKSLKNIVDALREPTQDSSEKLKDLYDEILGLYINIDRLSKCESAMMRFSKMEKIPNTLLAEIETKFSDLFIALNGVLAPKSIEKKELKEAFEMGITLEELSHGMGESQEDLIKWLQDSEIEEDTE